MEEPDPTAGPFMEYDALLLQPPGEGHRPGGAVALAGEELRRVPPVVLAQIAPDELGHRGRAWRALGRRLAEERA